MIRTITRLFLTPDSRGFVLLFIFTFVASALQAQTVDFTTQGAPSGCSPLHVTFRNLSSTSPAPVSYLWDFGNGNTSSLANPSAIYVTQGTYTVKLTVDFGGGNVKTVQKANYIEVLPRPVANFSSNVVSGCVPLQVTFDGSLSTTAGNSTIASYLWDFGNGAGSTAAKPVYTYTRPGTYKVSLVVTNNRGCNASVIKDAYITVYPALDPNFGIAQNLPCNPLEVKFTPVTPAPGTSLSYSWDFGDGTSSTAATPTRTYSTFGSFTVKLTVRSSNGCMSTLSRQFTISNQAYSFTATPPKGCEPANVVFENTSPNISAAHTVQWDFNGDGAPDLQGVADDPTMRTTSYSYSRAGSYRAALTVFATANPSCKTTVYRTIDVGKLPQVDFRVENPVQCDLPAKINFTGLSQNLESSVTYLWNFGDGTPVVSSSTPDIIHEYTAYGVYDVKLEVRNQSGCSAVLEKKRAVFVQNIAPNFEALIRGGCYPRFTALLRDDTKTVKANQGDPDITISDYEWKIFKGGVEVAYSTLRNPAITLTEIGNYDVQLTVRSITGCIRVIRKDNYLQVGMKPVKIDFQRPRITVCNGTPVSPFINQTVLDPQNPYPTEFLWGYTFPGGASSAGTYTPGTPYNPPTYNGSTLYDNLDPMVYSVALYTFSNGCRDTLIKPNLITIEPPVAKFASKIFTCDPTRVHMSNMSIGADRLLWTYGPNPRDTTSVANPVFVFPPNSVQTVKLQVWNNSSNNGAGCTHIKVASINIGPPQPPKWNFTVTPREGCYPHRAKFSANMPDAVSYKWDFGNGTTSESATANVDYTKPGRYTVRLLVTVQDGCIYDTIMYNYVQVYGQEKLTIEVDPSKACTGSVILFKDKSPTIAPIARRIWDFGDGKILDTNKAADSTVAHSYKTAGVPPGTPFTVTLTSIDSKGCQQVGTTTVVISRPRAVFRFSRRLVCEGDSVTFESIDDPTTNLGPISYHWMFDNDVFKASTQSTTKQYFLPGPHVARLIVFDANGCSDTLTRNFQVAPAVKPTPDFKASPLTASCPPLLATFIDRSQVGRTPIKEWKWDFGDGTTSELDSAIKIFTKPGRYTISLTVTDEAGCQRTIVKPDLVIVLGPVDSFKVDKREGYEWLDVNFQAFAPDRLKYTHRWDFGNGVTTGYTDEQTTEYTKQKLTARYRYPIGTYIPIMTVRDSTGCEWAPEPVIKIVVKPCPEIKPIHTTTVCKSKISTFKLKVSDETHKDKPVIYKWFRKENNAWTQLVNKSDSLTLQPDVFKFGRNDYRIEISIDDAGITKCMRSQEFTINVYDEPRLELPLQNKKIKRCNSQGDTTLNMSHPSHHAKVGYRWRVYDAGWKIVTERRSASIVANLFSTGDVPRMHRYVAEVMDTLTGCGKTDTVEVTYNDVPKVNLGADRVACRNSEVVLQLDDRYDTYQWQDGSTGTSQRILGTGVYWVRVKNHCGTSTDTVRITFVDPPRVSLGIDLKACPKDVITLDARASTGNSYLWQDGSTNAKFTVTQPGTYWVKVTNVCGSVSDTVKVDYLPKPTVSLGDGNAVCTTENELRLTAKTITGVTYNWDNGTRDSTLLVTKPGIYSVTVANKCGSASSKIQVYLNVNFETIEVPNIITPNGDGLNDFWIIPNLPERTSLLIYNRWGALVYESKSYLNDWDGGDLPAGAYFYTLSHVCSDKPRKGWIIIQK